MLPGWNHSHWKWTHFYRVFLGDYWVFTEFHSGLTGASYRVYLLPGFSFTGFFLADCITGSFDVVFLLFCFSFASLVDDFRIAEMERGRLFLLFFFSFIFFFK